MVLYAYDKIIVVGDFNTDINKDEEIGHDKLDVFCDTLNLTNLVKSETCYTNNHKSAIDLFLTNRPRSFQFTSVTETGLSDYHRLITTFMKSHFSRLKSKIIYYCNFKRFDEQKFIAHVKNADFSFETDKSSCSEVFCKKGVLENFTKFTGKHLCQSLFFNCNFIKEETVAQVFSCEFGEFLKNTFFFNRTPLVAASFETDDPNETYSALTNTFSLIVEKRAPLKKNIVRGNHTPFITKDLKKAIYTRRRL